MITSIHNRHVKALLRLRKRRERDLTGTFLIEGYRELRRASGTVSLRSLYYCPPLWLGNDEPALLAAAADSGTELVELAEEPFRRVSFRDRPDGLLGVGAQYPVGLDRLRLPPNPLILVAEALEKPGNLGAMLRTADAAGVSAAVVCDPVTDPFHPSVIRGSTGSVFVVPMGVADVSSVATWLTENGVKAVAATPAADRLHWEVDLRKPCAIVVGNEQHGLSGTWLGAATERVRIPMVGAADSLNVAMAAGVLVFEAVRQRTQAGAKLTTFTWSTGTSQGVHSPDSSRASATSAPRPGARVCCGVCPRSRS